MDAHSDHGNTCEKGHARTFYIVEPVDDAIHRAHVTTFGPFNPHRGFQQLSLDYSSRNSRSSFKQIQDLQALLA